MLIVCCQWVRAQGGGNVSAEEQFQQAMSAIEAAQNYEQLETTFIDYENVLSDPDIQASLRQALNSDELSDGQRAGIVIASLIVQEVQSYGAVTAAQLTGIRHLALTALSAQQTEELMVEMESFAPLADIMSADMVRQAFVEPMGFWPDALQSLFTEFGEIWPVQGSVAAVSQLQNSAQQYIAQTSSADTAPEESGADGDETYFEDRVADTFLELGMPIPDLIP